MKIEYKTGRSGYRFSIVAGDIEDVTEAKAERLIEMGAAIVADKDAEITVVKTVISNDNTKKPKKSGKKKK